MRAERRGNCYLHGGQHPNGKTAAANERASKLLKGLGQPVAIDPQLYSTDSTPRARARAWGCGKCDLKANQTGMSEGSFRTSGPGLGHALETPRGVQPPNRRVKKLQVALAAILDLPMIVRPLERHVTGERFHGSP